MKKMLRVVIVVALCVCGLGLLSALVGCDPAEGLDGMGVSPSTVTLTPGTNTVIFTATLGVSSNNDLALPLAWSVSDSDLGWIVDSSGFTAVYQSSGALGNNTVTARDQYGNEGFATVSQVASSYSLTLTATPSATLTSSNNTCTIQVTGGTPPYNWSVDDTDVGHLISGGHSDTVVYEGKADGATAVEVEDANGVHGAIVITRQPSTPVPGPGG